MYADTRKSIQATARNIFDFIDKLPPIIRNSPLNVRARDRAILAPVQNYDTIDQMVPPTSNDRSKHMNIVDSGIHIEKYTCSVKTDLRIALLHGDVFSSWAYRRLGEAISSFANVYMINSPNFGMSKKIPPLDVDENSYLKFFNTAIKFIEKTEGHVSVYVGHSRGGRTVLNALEDKVERVLGICINSFGTDELAKQPIDPRVALKVLPHAASPHMHLSDAVMGRRFYNTGLSRLKGSSADYFSIVSANKVPIPVSSLLCGSVDYAKLIQKGHPLLFIGTSEDAVNPVPYQRQAITALCDMGINAKYVILDGCHCECMINPYKTVRKILKFVYASKESKKASLCP